VCSSDLVGLHVDGDAGLLTWIALDRSTANANT
jgi:hypothetical protein